jgi:hypothetical protein
MGTKGNRYNSHRHQVRHSLTFFDEAADGDMIFTHTMEAFKFLDPIDISPNVVMEWSFEGLESVPLSELFFRYAFGRLYQYYSSEFIRAHIKVTNISPAHKEALCKVLVQAKSIAKQQKLP